MANLFLSYAHADGARAQRLLDVLKCDFDVWWDPHIQPGRDFRAEIPPRRYLFHPDRVNAYLGWLATRLSVRSQTSCSLRTLYSFLTRTSGGEPSPDAWTIRAARAMFVAAILAAVGLVMMPFDARAGTVATFLGVTAGCVVTYLAYSVLRERRRRDSAWIGMAIGGFLIFPGFAALSRSLSTLLPFELSPVPAGLLAAAGVASLVGGALEQATGRRSVTVATTAIGFAAGVALVYSDRVAWTGGVPLAATTVAGLMSGLWVMLAREDSGGYREKAQAIAITVLMLAFVLLLQNRGLAILGSLHWAVAFALIGSALVLIAASPKSSLSLLAVAVTAVGGHLLADEEGSVLAVALVAVAWMAWNLSGMASPIGSKRALVPWRDLDKRCENLVEYAVLSPLTAKCLAAQGRLPWRLRRFLRYAADALLLKPFDGEIEFVHRRLRDHFALRELVPQLDETDAAIRTRAVAALGFQGVSAVDALSDLAQGGDVGERVLAVKALGRIAAPEATDVLEQSMSDPSPEVRAAVIGSLGNTGSADRNRLLKRAAGDDALAVQYALIDAIIDGDLGGAPDQQLMEILERRLYPVELLRHLCSRAGGDDWPRDLAEAVGRELPDAAREQVRALLKDSDAAVRLNACRWIANKAALGDLETLAHLLGVDPVPGVRAAAASALAEIQDSTAVPLLIEALADDGAGVRSSAARALSHFEDERVVDPLIALLDDKSEGVRELAAKFLGEVAERRAVEPLIRALGDEVRAVRCEATRSLKKLGDQRAAEPLVRCLEDPDDVFWEWAAIALLELDPDRASAAMRRFLSDKSLVKRTAAVRALAADLDSIPVALLSRDVGEYGVWLDPAEPITRERVARCASVLNLSENEIRAHYEALAPDFKLRLKW